MSSNRLDYKNLKLTQEQIANLHYTPRRKSARLDDLTGQTFDQWYVIEQAPPNLEYVTMWKCRCSCGKLGVVRGSDLKNGNHKSCGHDRNHGLEDLTGRTFGELTVVSRAPNNKYGVTRWNCTDKHGNTKIATAYDLKSGRTHDIKGARDFIDLAGKQLGDWVPFEYLGSSMWKCQNTKTGEVKDIHSYSLRNYDCYKEGYIKTSKNEDLRGQKFGEWEPLEFIGGSHSKWKCKCSCGNIGIVAAYDLKSKKSTSCGHDKDKPIRDLTGLKFGHYTVIKYLHKGNYLCECDCGNIKEVLGQNLTSGNIVSCGCASKTEYTKEVVMAALLDITNTLGREPFRSETAKYLDITPTYVGQLCKRYGIPDTVFNTSFGSKGECDVYNFVKSIEPTIEIRKRDRTILNGKELDLYMPSKNLAIEYNGNYWHNAERVGETYHLDKSLAAAKQGIQVIHIFEYEWQNMTTREKIKEYLDSLIGANKINIGARECEIRKLDTEDESIFINQYHLQNYIASKLAFGLYYNNELVSVMSFGHPRMNQNYEWEILRYCTNPKYSIVGGAEKLYKAFLNCAHPKSVISYCDISKFNGQV